MIIYNVTIKVDHSITEEWLHWMKTEHIPDLMKTGLFIDHRLCRLLEQDEADGRTYTVQYFCDSLEHYQNYINEHAQKMRDKGVKKFGSKFIAFRTVMEVEPA
ncbi:MAG: DUF4286 family protein [Sphingobacteriales bacterium]|nr:MAG: DUF4286 family protein [Sphingobacteriales bacterium]